MPDTIDTVRRSATGQRSFRPATPRPEPHIDTDDRLAATIVQQDGRHARGYRRQRALIDAARDLFIERGYRGTTLEAIIGRAGGSRETIYRVFGGKHGLFGAIIKQSGEQLAASIMDPVALGLPPREGLARLADALVDIWQSDEGRAINRAVLSEGVESHELVTAWYEGGTKPSISALATYLEAQVKAGRLRKLDPPLVARQFLMLLMGEIAFPLLSGSDAGAGRAAQIDRCIDMILRAYAVPE